MWYEILTGGVQHLLYTFISHSIIGWLLWFLHSWVDFFIHFKHVKLVYTTHKNIAWIYLIQLSHFNTLTAQNTPVFQNDHKSDVCIGNTDNIKKTIWHLNYSWRPVIIWDPGPVSVADTAFLKRALQFFLPKISFLPKMYSYIYILGLDPPLILRDPRIKILTKIVNSADFPEFCSKFCSFSNIRPIKNGKICAHFPKCLV